MPGPSASCPSRAAKRRRQPRRAGRDGFAPGLGPSPARRRGAAAGKGRTDASARIADRRTSVRTHPRVLAQCPRASLPSQGETNNTSASWMRTALTAPLPHSRLRRGRDDARDARVLGGPPVAANGAPIGVEPCATRGLSERRRAAPDASRVAAPSRDLDVRSHRRSPRADRRGDVAVAHAAAAAATAANVVPEIAITLSLGYLVASFVAFWWGASHPRSAAATFLRSPLPLVPLCVAYLALLCASWSPDTLSLMMPGSLAEGLATGQPQFFPRLDGIMTLLSRRVTAASAWLHIACINFFVGRSPRREPPSCECRWRTRCCSPPSPVRSGY